MEDACRDKVGLEGVHKIRSWGRHLRQIAREDGIEHLKATPNRRDLLDKHGQVSGYPTFNMLSELGSHPSTAGNILFALDPESSEISYNLEGAVAARAFWLSASAVYFWQTCQVAAVVLSWDEWLAGEAKPVFVEMAVLIEEARLRHGRSFG